MAASARPGERATSFAVACSLLSRFVRQNGAAAAELGLGIKGERGRSGVWLLRLVAFGGRLQKIYFFFVWGRVCRLRLDSCRKLLFWGCVVLDLS